MLGFTVSIYEVVLLEDRASTVHDRYSVLTVQPNLHHHNFLNKKGNKGNTKRGKVTKVTAYRASMNRDKRDKEIALLKTLEKNKAHVKKSCNNRVFALSFYMSQK